MRNSLRVLLLIFCFVLPSKFVFAHPLSPSLLEFVETSSGQVAMSWKTPAAKVSGYELAPQLPANCQKIHTGETVREKTYWIQHWQLQCEPSWRTQALSVAGITNGRSNVILKIQLADGRSFHQVLNAETPSYLIPERAKRSDVFKSYLPLGFHHILSGWDHLLFVLGLFLLIKPGKKLLWAITAFTLGHSITLALASLEFISIPSQIAEVLIALSIMILAVQLLRERSRYSWVMAFSFGLLHGLGFAGALAEVGLPMGEIPLALFSFNVGIEAGQLCFIVGLCLLWKLAKTIHFPAKFKRIEAPAYVIGSLAAFWFFERLFQ